MRSLLDGNSTRDESADPCCPEHVAQLALVLTKWSRAILEASITEDSRVRVDQKIEEAILEITAVLESPCQGLTGSEGSHGKAAEDAEAQIDWVDPRIGRTPVDPLPGRHPPMCTCMACLDRAVRNSARWW